MVKASESRELIKAWASGLKQWLKWITGEAPVPDRRAKQILAGTAGAVVALIALVSLAGGGGGPSTGAKYQPPSAQNSTSAAPNATTSPAVPFASSATTNSAPTTIAPTAIGGPKGTHSRNRHAGAKRTHTTKTSGGP